MAWRRLLPLSGFPLPPAVGVRPQAETGDEWMRMDDGRVPVLEVLGGLEAPPERFFERLGYVVGTRQPVLTCCPTAQTPTMPVSWP